MAHLGQSIPRMFLQRACRSRHVSVPTALDAVFWYLRRMLGVTSASLGQLEPRVCYRRLPDADDVPMLPALSVDGSRTHQRPPSKALDLEALNFRGELGWGMVHVECVWDFPTDMFYRNQAEARLHAMGTL